MLRNCSLRFMVILLAIVSFLGSTSADEIVSVSDSAKIYTSGFAIQLSGFAIGNVIDRPEVGIAIILSSGIVMDLVGDAMDNHGNMAWTFLGTVSGTILGAIMMFSYHPNADLDTMSDWPSFALLLSTGPMLGTLFYRWSHSPPKIKRLSVVPFVSRDEAKVSYTGLGISTQF